MKPKVALVKDGFLPAGSENVRGRLSLPAIERCKELAANGWVIDGYTIAPKSVTDKTEVVTVTKSKVSTSKVVSDLPPQTRGEDLIPLVDGKPWVMGIRGCCDICRTSLTYCPCPVPKVLLANDRLAVVTFKPTVVRKG